MPKILFDQKAKKRFSQLPTHERVKVSRAIDILRQDTPELLNIKRMRVPKVKMFRIRIGNIRIIYEEFDSGTIYISIIDFRGNVY